jgi:hypothetical protein
MKEEHRDALLIERTIKALFVARQAREGIRKRKQTGIIGRGMTPFLAAAHRQRKVIRSIFQRLHPLRNRVGTLLARSEIGSGMKKLIKVVPPTLA